MEQMEPTTEHYIHLSQDEKRAIKASKRAIKRQRSRENRSKLRKNVRYIPPNAITSAGIFFGYFSVIMSVNKQWKYAVYSIIMAMITDVLDGKTARSLKAFSEFGKELDSFSDSISFGIAPSFFVYFLLGDIFASQGLSRSSSEPEKIGVSSLLLPVCFVFALCGVFRLVRFNITTVAKATKDDFTGLPIPSGAAMVLSYYLICDAISSDFKISFSKVFYPEIMMVVTLLSGLLMVSTVPFASPATVLKRVPKLLIPIIVIVAIVFIRYSVFIISFFYVAISLMIWIIERQIFAEKEARELYFSASETETEADTDIDTATSASTNNEVNGEKSQVTSEGKEQ